MSAPDLTILVAASNLLEQRAAQGYQRCISGTRTAVAVQEVNVVAACVQAHTAINMALQEMAALELTQKEDTVD